MKYYYIEGPRNSRTEWDQVLFLVNVAFSWACVCEVACHKHFKDCPRERAFRQCAIKAIIVPSQPDAARRYSLAAREASAKPADRALQREGQRKRAKRGHTPMLS